MIDTIQDGWFVWLMLAVGGTFLLHFLGKNRRTEVQPGMATKSDQFSMRTVFFSFRSGEAQLFFTVVFILGSIFLFALGLAKEIGSMLP